MTSIATNSAVTDPGFVGRLRSRQAGNPSGLLGRIIGRVMVKDTAASNDRALDLLDLTEPSTVLEVGFGQGRTVAEILKGGHRVLGVEASATMVSQASARNRQACKDGRAVLALGGGKLMPFDDDLADVALTVHTIYFMDDPQLTLTEIARVLRPGGRLVIACRVGDDKMPEWMDPEVYRIPTIAEVRAMLKGAGFATVNYHPGDESTRFTNWFTADLP